MNCEFSTLSKWIWPQSLVETPNCYVYMRKEFEVAAAPSADVCVTCSTEYKLYVNGRYIGRGPNPCHPAFQYYDSYDLSHVLRPGKNVIAAICYNYGVGTHCRPQAPGGFLLQLSIHRNGDEDQIIATDETWRVHPGQDWDFNSAQMFWTIGFQEVYDSRKKPVGWNVVGFDDNAWEQAYVVGEVGCKPWTSLIPRQIPPLREWQVFPKEIIKCGKVTPIDDPALDIANRMYREPIEIDTGIIKYPKEMLSASGEVAVVHPGADCCVVLDFGKEVVGFFEIKIRSAGSATIDIGYSEALDEHGNVFPTRQGIIQADRLILHGGRQEWQTFGRRAFRYVQLTFRNLNMPVEIESVHLNRVGYPVEQVSTFECSDELLNDIWRTGVYTLSISMQDAYEDCPLREHGQYPGDARVQALMNYYCYFDTALAAKALEQFVQSQREDGLFNALWPSSTNHILPDYNLVWIMMLHDYYLYTADLGLVQQLYPNMRLLLDTWCRSQESENGLLTWEPNPDVPMHEWWLFIDHAPLDKHGEVAAYNSFYYQALRDASKLALAVANSEDAANWSQRASEVHRVFNEQFWHEENGVFVDCNINGVRSDTISIQTNTLAMLFGLADVEQSARILDYLVSPQPRVESSGAYFDFYVLQALAMLGKTNEALEMIRSQWGEMLRRGATTWWEICSRTWPEGTICPDSLCHSWSGAPTYFLPAEVLGVKPSTPGGGIAIQPRVGDLAWAKGNIKTIAGFANVEWHNEENLFSIEIEAPEGFVVALPIDGFTNPIIDEIDLTPETPERRARRTYGWGTTIWRDGKEHDPYVDWLATQEAQPPDSYEHRERCSHGESYIWLRESVSNHVRYEIREG